MEFLNPIQHHLFVSRAFAILFDFSLTDGIPMWSCLFRFENLDEATTKEVRGM